MDRDYIRPPPDVEGMSTLKVDNLTYRTTAESLRKVFEKYGDIGDIYIPRDYYTKDSRGFAFVRCGARGRETGYTSYFCPFELSFISMFFVRFYDRHDAEDAMDTMDGSILDGRPLRVQLARYGRPDEPRGGRGRGGGRGGGRNDRDRDRRRSRSRLVKVCDRVFISSTHSRSLTRARARTHARTLTNKQTN